MNAKCQRLNAKFRVAALRIISVLVLNNNKISARQIGFQKDEGDKNEK